MLKALDAQGQYILAQDAERSALYLCPVCGSSLIFKAGSIVVKHFAHQPDAICALATGEGLRHLQMKNQIGKLFSPVDYEVDLVPGHRADIVIAQRIVVECQDSPISIDEWTTRTQDYNDYGYPVLWVWNIGRLATGIRHVRVFDQFPQGELRIPAEIRYCHRTSYGRLYALDTEGNLMGCHLSSATPRDREWYDQYGDVQSSSYTPKALRFIRFHVTLRCPTPFASTNNLRLVNLGEGVWWKG